MEATEVREAIANWCIKAIVDTRFEINPNWLSEQSKLITAAVITFALSKANSWQALYDDVKTYFKVDCELIVKIKEYSDLEEQYGTQGTEKLKSLVPQLVTLMMEALEEVPSVNLGFRFDMIMMGMPDCTPFVDIFEAMDAMGVALVNTKQRYSALLPYRHNRQVLVRIYEKSDKLIARSNKYPELQRVIYRDELPHHFANCYAKPTNQMHQRIEYPSELIEMSTQNLHKICFNLAYVPNSPISLELKQNLDNEHPSNRIRLQTVDLVLTAESLGYLRDNIKHMAIGSTHALLVCHYYGWFDIQEVLPFKIFCTTF
jgi:hypothetical protein